MKLRWIFSAVIAVPVLIAPLNAEEQKSKDKEQQSEKDAPKEKMICRSDTATGTRLRKNRICMTESQWREYSAQARKGVNDFSRQAGMAQPAEPKTTPF